MIDRFNEADTQVLGVSIDSKHSHKNWAESLGGVSFPLLQDFHPKGSMAASYGTYLEDKGFTTRSTVIVDKQGLVQYSVLANGERVISELLRFDVESSLFLIPLKKDYNFQYIQLCKLSPYKLRV